MRAVSRRIVWIFAAIATVSLVLIFTLQARRWSACGEEKARVSRETEELAARRRALSERGKELAARVGAATALEGRNGLSADEQRKRDLTAEIERIAPRVKDIPPKPPSPTGPHGNIYFAELMDEPGYHERARDFFRSSIETRYGAWLNTLSSPELRAAAGKILVEERLTEGDAEEIAARSGLDPQGDRGQVMRMSAELRTASRTDLRKLLGEDEINRFNNYEMTLPVRDSIGSLVKRLSYSSEPLSSQQIDQLVSSMPSQGLGFGPRFGAATPEPTIEEALAPAREVFSVRQWEAVQQFGRDGGKLGR